MKALGLEFTMKLYVGNLPWSINDQELKDLFSQHGNVSDAVVISDKETGRSRGFGFVEIDDSSGNQAIEAMDGFDIDGRPLKVNEARPKV